MFESVTTITEMARSKIAMNSFSTIQTEKSGTVSKTIFRSMINFVGTCRSKRIVLLKTNCPSIPERGRSTESTDLQRVFKRASFLERFRKRIKVKIISELEDLERQRADKKEPDKNIESRIEDLQNQLLDMLK